MKAADRSGARFALVLGERDLEAGIGVKALATGEHARVALENVVDAVRVSVSCRMRAEPSLDLLDEATIRTRARNVAIAA